MRVLITSGIWPPDVGGPASHGPELGGFLAARGHSVAAVTACSSAAPAPVGFPVAVLRRDRPAPLRLAGGARRIAGRARGHDVIYAAGLYSRAAAASALWRVPLVVKLAADPAYERMRGRGLFTGSLEEFQAGGAGATAAALRRVRNAMLRRASSIVIPSRYLAEIAAGWDIDAGRITVVPNPAPAINGMAPRAELRRRLGLEGPVFVFAGRLVRQKNVPLAVAALRRVEDASMVVIGDGPEAEPVARAIAAAGLGDRVTMRAALPRMEALTWVRAADAAVLPSDWENFPHAAVEALSVGTPVVATAVGGVPEIVTDGVDGVLVARGDEDALASALARVARDGTFAARLREGASGLGDRYAAGRVYSKIEAELVAAAGSSR